MKKEFDIDDLMAESWLTVAQLRHGGEITDGMALYNACKAQVDKVREALKRAGFDDQSIDHITYAQCALLDETVMSRKLPPANGEGAAPSGEERPDSMLSAVLDEGQKAWRSAPLQAVYFGSLRAGGALYERIAQVLNQPSPEPAVLTCYQRVLALGFQGQYSLSGIGQAQRDEVIAALNARVPAPATASALMIASPRRRRHSLLRALWLWIVMAVVLTSALWFSGHLWLQNLLHQQLPG